MTDIGPPNLEEKETVEVTRKPSVVVGCNGFDMTLQDAIALGSRSISGTEGYEIINFRIIVQCYLWYC